MELEEIKNIWKNAAFAQKNEAELAAMLKGKSRSIVARLKRSVWFELLFTFVAGLILLGYALTLPSGALKWTTVSLLILFVVYSFYYVKKLTLLNRFNTNHDQIKTNLERLIENLSSYLRFYRRSYTILYPVYFCLGLLFGAVERGADQFIENISKPQVIAYLVGLALLFFVCSTWLTNWYLKKLYGNHLEKLKSVLVELQGTEKQE